MWTTITRSAVVSLGAVAAVSVSLVQLRKECQDTTFVECLGDTIGWVSGDDRGDAGPQPPSTPQVKTGLVTPPKTPSPQNPSPPNSTAVQPPPKAPMTTSAPARGFTVINTGRDTVLALFASRCEERNWGSDRLGANEVIGPGQKRAFNFSDGSSCCFDLRARFKDNAKRDLMNVDVCRLTHWSVSHP